jgi:hypothetical protein
MVVVKKGRWGGVERTLSATDTPDGHYCIGFYSGHSGGSGCGSIHPPGYRVPFGLSFVSGSGRLSYVLGPVVSTAVTVSITLSNGHVIPTKTIQPPKSLLPGIAFYMVEKPCKTFPQTIIGRDSAGTGGCPLAPTRVDGGAAAQRRSASGLRGGPLAAIGAGT